MLHFRWRAKADNVKMSHFQTKSTEKRRHYCCICSNYRGKYVDGQCITLHRFPADEKLRKLWIKRLKSVSSRFSTNLKNDRLCSAHFVDGTYSRQNPVPCIFMVNNKQKIFKTSKIDDDDDCASSHTETESTTDVEIPMEVDSSTEDEIYLNPHLVLEQEKSVEVISLIFNDYCGTALQSQNPMHLNKEIQTDLCMKVLVDASTQTDKEYKETSSQTLMLEKRSIGFQVTRPDIAFEDIEKDKNDVMFYTGIPNAGTFYTLFDEMNDMHDNADKDGQTGRPRVLRKIDEFFLVLIRLRLGLLIEDLSQRFHISKTTCGDIINKWITYLSVKLSFLTPWPSKHVICKTLPRKFQRYPRCRVIIDCTEIFTQTPQSLQYKSLMYSHYKSHMTYKSLIGISPNGVITFASDLWVGSISDKQLTKACGILDLLEPGDQLMADKGFLISDLTTERGVELVIPPLKNKKFMRREIEETRRIANLRIYVEMAIARVKNFRILQGVMPITLSQQASQIWKICVGLTNLQPPLVNKD